MKSVHFSGICGSAMASTAVAMLQKGFCVTGSDENVYPPMSGFLEQHGIPVMSGYASKNLAHRPSLIVIGNALSRGNPEVEYVLDHKLTYVSLPELLKDFFIRGKRSLVVSGTHGKTTTTSLLAWIFEKNGLNPSYLIGGIPGNLGQGARFTESEWFIIEGDEYDTAFFDKRSKFAHYLPEVVIINNLEFDHADIFDSLEAVQTAFRRLINLVPGNGLLLANGDEPNLRGLLDVSHCPVRKFGLAESNDLRAVDLRLSPEDSTFALGVDVGGDGRAIFRAPLVGELNVRNTLAAVACARHCGISDSRIQAALDTFVGIKRRMEVRGVEGGITVVDDFGHHPTAIRETLRALRIKFPQAGIRAVFEPRSNTTRRNVFQTELVEAFVDADSVVVAEVARLDQLAPQLRLDPARLMRDLRALGKPCSYLPTVDDIIEEVERTARPGDVVCTFSNGGFGGIHTKLLERLGRNK